MSDTLYRLLIAFIGLIAFLALLGVTLLLAHAGQSVAAILTGTGAGGLAVSGFFRLLTLLGSR